MARVGFRLLLALVGLGVLVGYLLLAGLGLLAIVFLASIAPDPWLLVLALVLGSLVGGLFSYVTGADALLRGLDATPLDRRRAAGLYDRLDDLAEEVGIDPPALLVAEVGEPNAFSIQGPRRSAIVLDRSLFSLLEGPELEALLAHELAHLESGDALVQTLAYSLVRTVLGIVLLILMPLLLTVTGLARAIAWTRGRPAEWGRTVPARLRLGAELVVVNLLLLLTVALRAYGRRREYAADRRAAELTGRPMALARALVRIERATAAGRGPLATLYTRGEREDPLAELFATHPPTEERVERLRSMAEIAPRRTVA